MPEMLKIEGLHTYYGNIHALKGIDMEIDEGEIVSLIGEYGLPAIFTEVNGSEATAQAIARETGVEVCQLSMVMSGTDSSLAAYTDAIRDNVKTIVDALGEGQVRMD